MNMTLKNLTADQKTALESFCTTQGITFNKAVNKVIIFMNDYCNNERFLTVSNGYFNLRTSKGIGLSLSNITNDRKVSQTMFKERFVELMEQNNDNFEREIIQLMKESCYGQNFKIEKIS